MISYPVLNNRPIDQWRVADLKHELRKRRLPANGLKRQLLRRLYNSVRSEQAANEAAEDVALDAADDGKFDLNVIPQGEEATVTITEVRRETTVHATQQVEVPGSVVGHGFLTPLLMIPAVGEAPTVDVEASLIEAATAEGEMPESNAGENLAFQELQPHMESVAEPDVTDELPHMEIATNETIIVNDELSTDVKSDLTAPEVTSDVTEASKIQKQDSAPAPVDAFTSHADPMYTEVTAAPVSNDSISSDDISTNKKNSIEDNLDDNNFDLELEVKPKMVEPSPGTTSLGGDLQPLDVDKELVKNQSSLEDMDDTDNVDSYKIDSPEVGSPEKLNFNRSSSDESMEEDVTESKQVESNMKSDGLRGTIQFSSKDVNEVTLSDSVVEAYSVDTKEAEEKPAASAEKRKLEAEEIVASTEPIKQQRGWTGESGKVTKRQTLNQTVSEAPKEVFQPALKRSFGGSYSTAIGDSPKERIVPPSQKPATTSLRMDGFVRPFTLKAVQELLGTTGSVQNFWMDHIKTHCYVTFTSVDEAVATRNAVYNLPWPPNNGNHLVAEFVDPLEVKLKLEPPPPPAAPISPATASWAPAAQANPSVPRQAANPREELPMIPEPPVLTINDVFKKTQASPRIYYLPLSEEEVAAKLAQQGKGKIE